MGWGDGTPRARVSLREGLSPGSWHGIGATLLCQESCSWLFRAVKALDFPGSTWSLKAGEREKKKKARAQK